MGIEWGSIEWGSIGIKTLSGPAKLAGFEQLERGQPWGSVEIGDEVSREVGLRMPNWAGDRIKIAFPANRQAIHERSPTASDRSPTALQTEA